MTARIHLVAVSDGDRDRPGDAGDTDEALDLDGLFDRYSGYVARIGYRLLGRPEDVDDLVQDVFLDAHRGLGQVRDPAAIKGWLATIAVRRARGMMRYRRLRAALHLDDDLTYGAAAMSVDPPDRLLVATIYRCLDRMPVRDRMAWAVRYLMDEPLERVAELCGCSLATAKRRIKAAQERIMREVEDGDE